MLKVLATATTFSIQTLVHPRVFFKVIKKNSLEHFFKDLRPVCVS